MLKRSSLLLHAELVVFILGPAEVDCSKSPICHALLQGLSLFFAECRCMAPQPVVQGCSSRQCSTVKINEERCYATRHTFHDFLGYLLSHTLQLE